MNDLEKAIINQDLEQVKAILIKEPNKIEEVSEEGIWLPFLAARTGNKKIVQYIVEYSRASFDKKDEKNRGILHYAVESGELSIVKYFVERVGMSALEGDKNQLTPFQLAYGLGHQEMVNYFEVFYGVTLEQMYQNPIRTGMFPDPSIVCVGTDFYMVNSSFIYFPCIPISHSKDLIHWEIIGHAVTNPEWSELGDLEGGRGYWAPDISWHQGRFYITATYRFNDTGTIYRKQMIVSSDKPEGPYSKPVFIEEDGIDPSLFTDEDGKRYMLLNRGARIFEVSEEGKQLSEAKLLYYGHQKHAPEGAHLLKKDGWYYLFQAEGGTGEGHRISVSRSKELFGVYVPCPYNPIMRQTDKNAAIQRCGHGKPVKTWNDEWYMVYLCGRQLEGNYSILGRETALDPITWTQDGWPMVNNLQGPSVLQKKPNLKEHFLTEEKDDFKRGILSKNWMFPREPEKDAVYFDNSSLFLKASEEGLHTIHARNILLRRQQDFSFSFIAEFEIPTLEQEQECGITCYYDENTYLTYGIYKKEKEYFLKVTEHIGEENREFLALLKIKQEEKNRIELRVKTDGLKREFAYRWKESAWEQIKILENVFYLCDEGLKKGKRFTGAMVGVYGDRKEGKAFYTEFKKLEYLKEKSMKK